MNRKKIIMIFFFFYEICSLNAIFRILSEISEINLTLAVVINDSIDFLSCQQRKSVYHHRKKRKFGRY